MKFRLRGDCTLYARPSRRSQYIVTVDGLYLDEVDTSAGPSRAPGEDGECDWVAVKSPENIVMRDEVGEPYTWLWVPEASLEEVKPAPEKSLYERFWGPEARTLAADVEPPGVSLADAVKDLEALQKDMAYDPHAACRDRLWRAAEMIQQERAQRITFEDAMKRACRQAHEADVRACRLSDECGKLKTENTELLRENAVLRREVERLERRGKQ